jgi:hypothetical protein
VLNERGEHHVPIAVFAVTTSRARGQLASRICTAYPISNS